MLEYFVTGHAMDMKNEFDLIQKNKTIRAMKRYCVH